MKLNIGEFTTDYSKAGKDYAEELQLCQRYFQKSYNLDTAPGTATTIGYEIRHGRSDSSFLKNINFLTRMRTAPSMQNYTLAGATQSNPPYAAISDRNISISWTAPSYSWQWTADAEL